MSEPSPGEAHTDEDAQPFRLYLTEDFKEAATAFAEKRPPRGFKGR